MFDKNEIIEMALNSGLPSKESVHNTLWWLEAFAKLVAAKEREHIKEEQQRCYVARGEA